MKGFALMALGASFLLAGCAVIPSGVQPVKDFEVDRYTGKWYEIARLDHRFERGLSNVSATYTLRSDEGVDVLNRGYDVKSDKWKEARGRAYFAGGKDVGQLKVTFFWPFYGGYNVIALDREGCTYAMVCGPNRSYLWILARERRLDPAVLDKLIAKAAALGFDTDELIVVEHDLPDA